MKYVRIILLVFGIILIVLNVIVNTLSYLNGTLKITASPEGFGTLIGSTLFIWVGIILLQQAGAIKKKIKAKELQKEIDEIGE